MQWQGRVAVTLHAGRAPAKLKGGDFVPLYSDLHVMDTVGSGLLSLGFVLLFQGHSVEPFSQISSGNYRREIPFIT